MSRVILSELAALACTLAYLVLGRGWELKLALLVVAGGSLVFALLLVMVVFGVDAALGTSEDRRVMLIDVRRIVRKDLADLWAALKFWK